MSMDNFICCELVSSPLWLWEIIEILNAGDFLLAMKTFFSLTFYIFLKFLQCEIISYVLKESHT